MIWKILLRWIYDQPLQKGELLGNSYRIEKCVGMGGYGMIYRCTHIDTNKQYVAKQLRPSKALKKKEKQRFLQEIKLISSLNHHQIPRLIDTIESDKEVFYVMEYIDGVNIEDLLFYEKQTFSEIDALKLIQKLLDALAYLHDKHIYHHDIRPPNILIKENNLYLIDYGLAKHASDQKEAEVLKKDDFFDIGECLLYLLYSTYTGKRKRKGSWLTELELNEETTNIIKKLLGIDKGYQEIQSIRYDIENAIKKLLLI